MLRPADIVVALRLALQPGERYELLASALGIGVGSAHRSVRRLEQAGLVVPGRRKVIRGALHEFLAHGVRYAFYVEPGRRMRGVPTAHAAFPLADILEADEILVWPSREGQVIGAGVEPLYPGAPDLPDRDPELYRMLALVDAVRVGGARERSRAIAALGDALELSGMATAEVR